MLPGDGGGRFQLVAGLVASFNLDDQYIVMPFA